MGMPACRISDATAHGGIVTLGFPQVLIGGLPASRIGDLHVCPMLTVLVPHVGGPFILGSPTVLVGMMPQSRVTDMLTCVGPPDTAIVGEFTVLVGMAGAGGAAGASAGVAEMGAPVPPATPLSVSGGSPSAALEPSGPASPASSSASLQKDGTVRTFATSGQGLPPIALKQEGWPELLPEITVTFQSAQPANIFPGTRLYAAVDEHTIPGTNSFWSADPPLSSAAGDGWNDGTHVLVHTVPAGVTLKGWAGEGVQTGKMQVWLPAEAVQPAATQRFRMGTGT